MPINNGLSWYVHNKTAICQPLDTSRAQDQSATCGPINTTPLIIMLPLDRFYFCYPDPCDDAGMLFLCAILSTHQGDAGADRDSPFLISSNWRLWLTDRHSFQPLLLWGWSRVRLPHLGLPMGLFLLVSLHSTLSNTLPRFRRHPSPREYIPSYHQSTVYLSEASFLTAGFFKTE